MAAGLYTWETFRFDVFCVNPPLVRVVATVPVVLCSPKYNMAPYSGTPYHRCEWSLGDAFIVTNDAEHVRWYFALARWTCIPFCAFGGYMCYRLAKELYGETSGICALILWCFSPLLLGCGATICPEIAAAGMGVTAIYAFRCWLLIPDWDRAILGGLLLGILPLTKLTWIIALGIWPVLWLAWRFGLAIPATRITVQPSRFVQLAIILVLAIFVVNLGYGFEDSFRPLGKYEFVSKALSGIDNSETTGTPMTANRFAATCLGKIPVPLPGNFVQGIDTQRYDFERGLPSYLRGEWADHGWWYFYLYALALKEPLGTWCLVALAIGVSTFGRKGTVPFSSDENRDSPQQTGYSASWRDEMVVLVPGLVILMFVSSQTGFSVHSRYVIPALPFLFVWTSKVARALETREGLTLRRQVAKVGWYFAPWRLCVSYVDWLRCRKQPVMAVLVILALAWSVGSSLAVYPHSLSYFNELAAILPTPADSSYPKPVGGSDDNRSVLSTLISAGPRNGPRHLLDSNIDWGQDLFYLKDWLDQHPDVKLDGLAVWGSYPATLAGIPETPLPPIGPDKCDQETSSQSKGQLGPKPGWYALSVNYLYSRDRQYRYFLHFQPVAMAGYSIYIYHISASSDRAPPSTWHKNLP